MEALLGLRCASAPAAAGSLFLQYAESNQSAAPPAPPLAWPAGSPRSSARQQSRRPPARLAAPPRCPAPPAPRPCAAAPAAAAAGHCLPGSGLRFRHGGVKRGLGAPRSWQAAQHAHSQTASRLLPSCCAPAGACWACWQRPCHSCTEVQGSAARGSTHLPAQAAAPAQAPPLPGSAAGAAQRQSAAGRRQR